jgi:dTDP-glucose 4,6-dehydratase
MRAIITGGAGFIGSHLCESLLNREWDIVCLDNLLTGAAENLASFRSSPRFQFKKQDVTEPFQIDSPVDFVLHFASPASPVDFPRHPIEIMKVGSLGTFHALELAREKAARFLLASTSECYGDPEVHPQSEDYWGRVNPVGPRAAYDESKRVAEALTMSYHRVYSLGTKIARIFNTYGPRMRLDDGRALPNFVGQALRGEDLTVYGDGSQTRSFCYISDLAEGIYALMMSKENLPVNLGNPEEITILDFARRILALTGSKSKIVFRPLPQDDPKQRCPDISRARKLLGWVPKVSLEEGLRRTIAYYQQQIGK